MKNKFAFVAAAALLLTGCGTSAGTSDTGTAAAAGEAAITDTAVEQPSEGKIDLRDNLSPRERLGYERSDSPNWVKALLQAENSDQLFAIAGYDTSSAWISMHEKDSSEN